MTFDYIPIWALPSSNKANARIIERLLDDEDFHFTIYDDDSGTYQLKRLDGTTEYSNELLLPTSPYNH